MTVNEFRSSGLVLFVGSLCSQTISSYFSCVLSSVLHGPSAQLVFDLLCAENKFTVSHHTPLNFHSSSFCTVSLPPPGCLFSFSLIIPYIHSPLRPACSMTPGLPPWRTNHVFHSGSKREVLSFGVYLLLPTCLRLLVELLNFF